MSPASSTHLVLSIGGMTCSSCSNTVETLLRSLDGVITATVTISTNTADVDIDDTKIDFTRLKDEIEVIGFDCDLLAKTKTSSLEDSNAKNKNLSYTHLVLSIGGMTCSSCSSTVESLLNSLEGVLAASVAIATNTADVDIDESSIDFARIKDEIEAIGFDCDLIEKVKKEAVNKVSTTTAISQYMVTVTSAVPGHIISVEEIESFRSKIASQTGVREVEFLEVTGSMKTTQLTAEKTHYLKVACILEVFGPRDVLSLASDCRLLISVTSLGGFTSAARLSQQQEEETAQQRNALIVSCVFTVPILFITMVLPAFPSAMKVLNCSIFPGLNVNAFLLFLLSFPVQWIIGMRFHRKAWKSVVSRSTLGMDFLISTGTCAAYLYSFIGLINALITGVSRNSDVEYFETAAVLITVVVLGKFLETFAKGRTASAIHNLTSMRARRARLVTDSAVYERCGKMGYSIDKNKIDALQHAKRLEALMNNSPEVAITVESTSRSESSWKQSKSTHEEERNTLLGDISMTALSTHDQRSELSKTEKDPSEASNIEIDAIWVHKLDCLRLVSGESVPTDGIILSGFVGVDESMLTGESVMITKSEGAKVFGGTTIVEGSAIMIATACGDDSTLGKIVATVQSAQASKPPIQELADKVAHYFVPVVSMASLLTFMVWMLAWALGLVPKSWYADHSTQDHGMMMDEMSMTSPSTIHANGSPILFAFLFALAVWVSACPCAFGLATPTAILVATGVAAKFGVLIRRGAALQFVTEVDTIAFDKTGTLTCGRPEVSDCFLCDSTGSASRVQADSAAMFASLGTSSKTLKDSGNLGSPNDSSELRCDLHILDALLMFVCLTRAESRSSHPLAKGILEYAKAQVAVIQAMISPIIDINEIFDAQDDGKFEMIPGQGVKVTIAVRPSAVSSLLNTHQSQLLSHIRKNTATWTLLVGSASLLATNGVEISSAAHKVASGLRDGGKVTIFLSIEGFNAAVLGVADAIRPESYAVVQDLIHMGKKCYMITGDERSTAYAIGSAIGIDPQYIFAKARPEDKESFISALQTKGHKVLFIGDGTNDSPALARAHVGIAMASGTDVAVESGDIVFCKNSLESLPVVIELSKQTLRRIQANYFWALCYNTVLIPIAAGVLYPSYHFALAPMMTGTAMAMSSVSIVVSSLLLAWFQPPQVFQRREQPHTDIEHGATAMTYNPISAKSKERACDCPASYSPEIVRTETLLERLFSGLAVCWTFVMSTKNDGNVNCLSLLKWLFCCSPEMTTRIIASTEDEELIDEMSVENVLRSAGFDVSILHRDDERPETTVVNRKKDLYKTLIKAGSLGCGCKKDNCKCGMSCMCGVVTVT